MALYLLDTNIISHALRDRNDPCARRIAEVVRSASDSVCTSIFVSAELRFGALKKGSSNLAERVEQFLASLPIHPFAGDADFHYAEIRHALERAGTPISANDTFIAAHARSLQAIVVTDNVDEFSRVPNLPIENWIVRPQRAARTMRPR
jgi:tRNA(fMet)-specific endonuclease VapC